MTVGTPNYRVPFKQADEYDALTKAKRHYHWNPGIRKLIKRGMRRRERKAARQEITDILDT